MTKVDARLAKLETAGASARVCQCAGGLLVIFDPMRQYAGKDPEPVTCGRCGRRREMLLITYTEPWDEPNES